MLQQRLAIGCVAAVHRRYISGFEGIGQQTHRHARVGAAGQVHQPRRARNEVRGNHDQLTADACQLRRQLRGEQQLRVRVGLGQYLARRIPQRLVPGPDQLATPDVHARLGLVGAQAVIQGVVLLARLGQ